MSEVTPVFCGGRASGCCDRMLPGSSGGTVSKCCDRVSSGLGDEVAPGCLGRGVVEGINGPFDSVSSSCSSRWSTMLFCGWL